MLMKTKYFTFQEVLGVYPLLAPTMPNASVIDSEWFTKILTAAGLKYNILGLSASIPAADIKAIINLLMTIVYNRHYDEYLYSMDMELNEDLDVGSDTFPYAIKDVINVINLTAPKYIPLFNAFKSKSDDPIGKVESITSGTARYNDTPQDEGDFADDEHTTNISQTETTQQVDAGSIMTRLAELYKDFKSIILEWANEFDKIFLREEQLQ